MEQMDNTYLADKAALRADHLPDGEIRVLDCYGGKGLVWHAVQKLARRKIKVLPVDIRNDLNTFRLPGDNRAFLQIIDLTKFNVVDLDAYGVPYDQLRMIFERGYIGKMFVTFIQSLYGKMPYGLLEEVGFTAEMIKRSPTLFGRRGWDYFLDYLALHGVTKVWHRSHARKHYLFFDASGLK